MGPLSLFSRILFLLTVFYLPYLIHSSDYTLSLWAVSVCGFYETNPFGFLPVTFVVALDFIVGGFGVYAFVIKDFHPRLSAAILMLWTLYVFVFAVALHDNILKIVYRGCAYGGG